MLERAQYTRQASESNLELSKFKNLHSQSMRRVNDDCSLKCLSTHSLPWLPKRCFTYLKSLPFDKEKNYNERATITTAEESQSTLSSFNESQITLGKSICISQTSQSSSNSTKFQKFYKMISLGSEHRPTGIAACSDSCKEIPRIISIEVDDWSLALYQYRSSMDESIGSLSCIPKFIEFNETDQYDIVPLDESLEKENKVPLTNDLLAGLDVERIFFSEDDSEYYRINLVEI